MLYIKNILVSIPLAAEQKNELESILPGAAYHYADSDKICGEILQKADIIFGNIAPGLIQKLPKSGGRLKWMQLITAGSDSYQKSGLFPRDAVLTNASGCYGDVMAEFMLGMLLSVKKNIITCRDNQNAGMWRPVDSGTQINGSTTLIIGLGNIGGAFAKRMKALGSYIIGVRRANMGTFEHADEMHLTQDIDSLIHRADIIALTMPATTGTWRILSRDRIAALKSDAIIVNVGRGSTIDTEALCDALYEHKIGGACLDVTDPEPLPEGHRLWNAPNCLITPHISGDEYNPATYKKIIDLCFANFRNFVSGEVMRNIVDFDRGY